METRICTKCKVEQPILEFYQKKKDKPERKNECRTCDKARKITPVKEIPDLEGEIWSPVVGYNEFIEKNFVISNFFRMKRHQLSVNKTNKLRVWCTTTKGYLFTTIKVNGIGHIIQAHRAVALAFIPNPLNLPEVNHMDLDKSNCNVWNLEWSTSADNVNHAWENGACTPQKGEKNAQAKLTEEQVLEIRAIGGNLPQKVVAEVYGIKEHNVYQIQSRKRWKHI